MHRVGAARGDGSHEGVLVEVALLCRRGADPHGVVRLLDMQRFRVGIGVDGDRSDAESTRRLDHAAGDFTAVGDQKGLEHLLHPENAEPVLGARCRAPGGDRECEAEYPARIDGIDHAVVP